MSTPTHIGELVPDPANRRTHTPRNLGMVVDALHAVGAARSIVIDEDGVILAGNGVTEAAAEAGITKVRVVDASGDELVAVRRVGLSPAQKRALALYDNRAAELAEWDVEQLTADLANGEDLAAFFLPDELTRILGTTATPGRTEPDAVPELRATAIVAGDLFALGRHRLACGDATVVEDVARVMAGELAGLVFTDPPYGVEYDGGTKLTRALVGDASTALYRPTCDMAARFSADDAAFYLWHAAGLQGIAVAADVAAAGYVIRAVLVWNKNVAQFGLLGAQYKGKFEPIYYCHKRGHAPRWFGPTNEVTVWDCDRAADNAMHPTQKPVALAVRALGNSSACGDGVLDLFGGSGSTLIACEQTDRACRMIELEPAYCQVIVDRWEQFTGQAAVKIGEAVRA